MLTKLLYYGAFSQAQAQTPAIVDSLQKMLTTSINHQQRADTYNLLAAQYHRTDSLKVASFTAEALRWAKRDNYVRGICQAYYYQGYNYTRLGHFLQAEQVYNKMIPLAQAAKDYHSLHLAWKGLGINLAYQRKSRKSLECFKKSLSFAKQSDDKTLVANAYNNMGNNYKNLGNIKQALHCYQQSLDINKALDNMNEVGINYNNLALIYSRKGAYKKALAHYQSALRTFRQSDQLLRASHVLNNMGLIYLNQSNYLQAAYYFNESLQIRKSLDDAFSIAVSYTNLGLLETRLGRYPEAIGYHLKALKHSKKLNNQYRAASSYNNIGVIYQEQNNFGLARQYYFKALRIFTQLEQKLELVEAYRDIAATYDLESKSDSAQQYFKQAFEVAQQIGDQKSLGLVYKDLGIFYRKKKQCNQSQEYLHQAKAIFTSLKNYRHLSSSQIALGQTYYDCGEYQKAQHVLEKGLELAKKKGDIKANGYSILSATYAKLGDYQKAYENHLLFKATTDSLFNRKNTRKIAQLEERFKYKQQKDSLRQIQVQEKKQLQTQIIQQTLQNRLQQRTLWLVLGIALVLLGFTIYVYRSRQLKQKLNEQLQIKKAELEVKNETLEASKEEISVQRDMLEEKNNTLALHKERIEQSFRAARRIQKAFLPSKEYLQQCFNDCFILYLPKDVVSGDFYWASKISNIQILVVGDCTGHGVPGAFTTMICHKVLDQIVKVEKIIDPAVILSKMQVAFLQERTEGESSRIDTGLDVAILAIEHQQACSKVTFAGARHDLLYTLPKNEDVIRVPSVRQSIGGFRKQKKTFNNHTLSLPTGSTLYMGSDGLVDQNDGTPNKFGTSRLLDFLKHNQSFSLNRQKNKLTNALYDFMNQAEQRDDILWVGVKL
ncbi:serine/threonine protein kinases, putative [Microscilla marina ATCC 23134]|uniref:Serine/threonine protein kinases, putative n=1 Tax=Microscilla marina ATCC 23134 TaxID=313606 RepID=A1ZMC6_MICM2|nr:serine/threonine protein kinases, putative [Microscilla marina ATCC 23134]